MSDKVLVVAPTYNEADNVIALLEGIRAAVPSVDILIVDDNSPDGTGQLVTDFATAARSEGHDGATGRIELLTRAAKAGLGSAYREGFAEAVRRGYDVVVSMDVDLSHDPAEIPAMLRLIDGGADVVIGSRYVPGGSTVNWPWYRRVLSRWGNRYTSFVLRLPVGDCTSGFRAYRLSRLAAIDPSSTTAEGYAFLTELVRRLVRAGATVVETPIVFRDRRFGVSKMSGRIIAESMLLVTSWGVRDLVAGRGGARRANT